MGASPARVEDSARVGAAQVHWRREGSGPAVVFLHGFPLSGETWDKVVLRLRDRFTCYMPDLIGLGQSHSTDPEDYSSPGQARAFQGLLSRLGVESYALVGNDTGGWIARELALVDQARVSRLVLTNTEIPFHRPPWIPTYQLLARAPGSGAVLRRLLGSAAFRRSPLAFGGCFHDLAHLEGEFQERYVEPLIRSDARMAGALQFLRRMKFARLDEFERLHRELTLPTLFVWGRDDPTFPAARARAMLDQLPSPAGFHEVANAKLFVYEEQPEPVARLIGSFLSRSGSPEAG
jgi:pimeloyl-ACP methyl ester carboxylesterase